MAIISARKPGRKVGKVMLSARIEQDLLQRFRALVMARGTTAEAVLTAAIENYMSEQGFAGQPVTGEIALKPGRRSTLSALMLMDEPVVILGLDHDEGEGGTTAPVIAHVA